MGSHASKKARRVVRQHHYRVAPTFEKTVTPPPEAEVVGDMGIVADFDVAPSYEDLIGTVASPVVQHVPLAEPSSRPPAAQEYHAADMADTPTIVLSPAEIHQLTRGGGWDAEKFRDYRPEVAEPLFAHWQPATPSRPIPDTFPPLPPEVEGFLPLPAELPPLPIDPPTLVLDVHVLLSTPAPSLAPPPTPPHIPAVRPDSSWPRAPRPFALGRFSPGPTVNDADGDFSKLRSRRLSHRLPQPNNEPHEMPLTSKLKQIWGEMKPGLDRVLGRSHRAGLRGTRSTSWHTSAQLPAVHMKSLQEPSTPAIQRLSQSAKHLGVQANVAAQPALLRLHAQAERLAQRLVDRIDERLGAAPPLQHVLLGPGRLVIAFAQGVSIRDAQYVIAAAQAHTLRRIVGYNAYLILVPPGREVRYAQRFQSFQEVIGVHFGAPHQAQTA